MFRIFRIPLLTFLIILTSARLYSQTVYALRNVSVIPMNKEIVLKNKTVVIGNKKIISIQDNSVAIPKGATIVDGTGKFLLPGFFDMHAHFFNEQGELKNTCETELKIMLANGLTTARIMAGHPNYLEARQKVRDNKWIGPELVVASPQFAGRWPWPQDFKNFELTDTKEKAVAAVKKYKQEGYDAIKITFMVNRDVYDGIISTAKEVGIKVTGHVGPLVKLQAALDAKQQIEHMDEFIDMLLPDTSYNHGQSVSDMNLWSMKAWSTVPYLDQKKIPALVNMVKNAGVYVTPTNFFFISCFGTAYTDDIYRQRDDYSYIPQAILPERWKVKEMNRNMKIPKGSLDKYVALRKNIVYELWKAGVPLMAGSDSPEWFLVTGFSIHDEIDMFVQAGLTPFAALQTATVNTASYLEMKDKGTIEQGKIADLLLLDKNPLDDIKNTKSINAVFRNGVFYSKDSLNSMLEEGKILGK